MNVIGVNKSFVEDEFWLFKGQSPHIDKWFLMTSPIPLFSIWLFYMLFILRVGPNFMYKRQPININKILIVYNIIQVMASVYLFLLGSKMILNYGLVQKTCLMNRDEVKTLVTTGVYYYLLAKVSELLETVFFVLRKKQRQITFLHIYHHSVMMICTWLFLKYEPTYSTIFLGTLNSFVHVIMYGYYALSAIPGIAKYLWWKKYITSLQLIQFVAVIIQAAIHNAITECPPSYLSLVTIFLNSIVFLWLFGNFYIKSYTKTKKIQSSTKIEQQSIDKSKKINEKSIISERIRFRGD